MKRSFAVSMVGCATLVAGYGIAPTTAQAAKSSTTEMIDVSSKQVHANGQVLDGSMSGNGRYTVFSTTVSNLVKNTVVPWQQVYLRDRKAKKTILLSKTKHGDGGDRDSRSPVISRSGRYVVYATSASNLGIKNKKNTQLVVRLDRKSGKLTTVSVGRGGHPTNDSSGRTRSAISNNGRYVAFISDATNLVKRADTDSYPDLYLTDLQKHRTVLVSHNTSGAAVGALSDVKISDDGRYVVYGSSGDGIAAGSPGFQAYLYDRVSKTNVSLSKNAVFNNFPQSTGASPTISGDGHEACFRGSGGAGDLEYQIWCTHLHFSNGVPQTPTTSQYVKVTNSSNGDSDGPELDKHGRTVAFNSTATDLGPKDTNGVGDVYLARIGGGKALVSVTRHGKPANGNGSGGSTIGISSSGQSILFDSSATNLVPKDHNNATDLFLRVR